MKRKKFIRGAAALGVSGTAVKCLGALYRVPVVALVGCYGLGIYQSTYAFYAFIVTLCSAGVASCLSKQTAERLAAGDRGDGVARAYARLFFRIGIAGGIAVAVFPLFFRGTSYAGYALLAPAVPAVCISCVLCGKTQGAGDMYPSAASEVIGQIVKICFGLLFCLFLRRKPHLAARALCLAVTIAAWGETAALLFFEKRRKGRTVGRIFPLFSDKKIDVFLKNDEGIGGDIAKFCTDDFAGRKTIARERIAAKSILSFTLPVAFAAAMLPLTAFAESLLLPNLMRGYVPSPVAAYGLFAGGAVCLSHLPATLCRGVATAAIPDLSAAAMRTGFAGAKKKVLYSAALTLFVAVPVCAGLCVFAPIAVKILFRSLSAEERETMIACVRISAAGMPLFAAAQTLSSCMTALNEQKASAACWGVACLSRLLFDLIFVGALKFSAIGAAIAEVGCNFVAFFLISSYNIIVFKKARR